jgi:nucleotide-binding universal stress UspA family protein
MNIKHVLVPVDFSPPSRLAVNYGVSFARKFHTSLTLLHVIESGAALVAGFPVETAAMEKQHRDQACRMLSALVAPEDQDDLDLRIVIKSGDIEDEIISVIDKQRAGIVVMGTHGRGLFSRFLIGSVTQGILRKVPVPILTVCRATQPLAFSRILFATDCSESSKHAFDFVLKFAHDIGSEVTVLNVLEPVAVTYGGAEMAEYIDRHHADQVQSGLADFVVKGARQDVRVETTVVEGLAADEIVKIAEESSADLLLITVKHKGLIERALLGTTAERLIREAHVPVLSIPVE